MAANPKYEDPLELKSRLKESYDAMAPIYNTWTAENSPMRMHFVERLIELLMPSPPSPDPAKHAPHSILELGAGAGVPATTRLLTALPGAHVTANDISSTQVSLGRANLAWAGDRVSWVEGDMTTAVSVPDASLDAALALYSVIHLPRAEQEVMLGRIWRWLRPGGYLLANFSEEAFEGVVMERWLHEKGWMFWSGFGAEAMLEKLKGIGFDILVGEVKGDCVDGAFLWVIARKPVELLP